VALAGAHVSARKDRERRRALAHGVPTPGGVPDLGALKARGGEVAEMVGAIAEEAKQAAEVRSGMRCQGCGERITRGYEFIRFRVYATPSGKPEVRKQMTYACSRDECDYAMVAAQHSSAMRPVEWAFLDEGPGAAVVGRLKDAPEPVEPEQEWRDPGVETPAL
jgi:hypothetical protein